ncbi:hypothetical protein ACI3KS_14615 [Microbacterium sp. ZW T5_45]|uniref:hypothetical protein n=1 Tax=Microbacterium sp. ZW T5_45 TaxID=3378080 RepID=UPI0038542F2F
MSARDDASGSDGSRSDAELFARLRTMWTSTDPEPASLVDRMIAAIATDSLSQEYALLTLVETPLAAVRGDAEALTLQFTDGTTSILLHITTAANGTRRIDGWVDAPGGEIELEQHGRARLTRPTDTGRFAFDDVRPGLSRVRLTPDASDAGGLVTPLFEL